MPNEKLTITQKELLIRIDERQSGGSCGPFNAQNGFIGLQDGIPNVIKLYKYDGSAICGNGTYMTVHESWRCTS